MNSDAKQDNGSCEKSDIEVRRFFLYEPKSKLFLKKDGLHRWWSCFENKEFAWAELTHSPQEAYSVSSKKETETFFKDKVAKCGFGKVGTLHVKAELDELLGVKVDNSAMCVIINVKWLVVKEATISYKIL